MGCTRIENTQSFTSMLRKLISKSLRRLLLKRNRWLLPIETKSPTGADLAFDLPFIVKKSTPLIFDVGANVGQSIDLFSAALPGCRIMAFEPSPNSFAALKTRYTSPNVQLHQMALGLTDGKQEFHQYELSVLNSLLPLDPNSENCFSKVELTDTIYVETLTLDSFCNTRDIDMIDLLKIDTQGYDYNVLLGARGLMSSKKIQAISVEINFTPMYEGQGSAADIISLLSSNNFKLVDFYEKIRTDGALAWCTALFKL